MKGRASLIALLFACALFGGVWWTQARASASAASAPRPAPDATTPRPA